MNIDNKLLAVALGSVLVGGGAVAAFNSIKSHDASASPSSRLVTSGPAAQAQPEIPALDLQQQVPSQSYAMITNVKPVTQVSTQYASVLNVEPVNRTVASSQPRQECHDVPVTQRLPERDGNVGGTVVGAIIGGAVGNQLGKNRSSDRRKIETAAGAVGGAFLGRYIDQQHVGGRVVQATERQCRTVSDVLNRNELIGYDVTFRNPDGTTGMKRMSQRPGSRIALGNKTVNAGYDVSYQLDGETHVVRMDQRPGVDRFKVVDGQVITRI